MINSQILDVVDCLCYQWVMHLHSVLHKIAQPPNNQDWGPILTHQFGLEKKKNREKKTPYSAYVVQDHIHLLKIGSETVTILIGWFLSLKILYEHNA